MQVESPNQSGSSVRLGPEIAAIRRLSVAAVNCLALNLQNRTPYCCWSIFMATYLIYCLSLETPVGCYTT